MSMVCSVVDNSDSLSGVLVVSVSQKVGFLPIYITDITDAGKRTETCASIKEPGGQQTLGSAICQHQTLPCPAHTSGCWETNLAEMAAGSLWWSVDVVCKCCDSPSHSVLSSSQAPWWMICHSQLLDQDGEMQMLSSPGVWDTLCVVDSCLRAQKYRNFFPRVNLSPATLRQGCGPTTRKDNRLSVGCTKVSLWSCGPASVRHSALGKAAGGDVCLHQPPLLQDAAGGASCGQETWQVVPSAEKSNFVHSYLGMIIWQFMQESSKQAWSSLG